MGSLRWWQRLPVAFSSMSIFLLYSNVSPTWVHGCMSSHIVQSPRHLGVAMQLRSLQWHRQKRCEQLWGHENTRKRCATLPLFMFSHWLYCKSRSVLALNHDLCITHGGRSRPKDKRTLDAQSRVPSIKALNEHVKLNMCVLYKMLFLDFSLQRCGQHPY